MAMLRLEVFESADPAQEPVAPSAAGADQESRLEAYEQGYRAGWEDAAAAHAEDQRRIRVDLARSLQALGFTYQEARAHVLKSLAPLMQDMVGKLLPEMAREALAPTVLETLMPLAEQLADEPVTLVVNANDRKAIEELLEQATGLPVTIVEEATLSEGQAFLRLGLQEVHIDLARATAEIAAAVRGFFGFSEKE
ncbi:MAG: flagellar biosynthesis protein [Gemmobacter sp.]|uniref:flagellar biosynthesis protein n=1 Tax=Gemmobacter sp. TaxID=1898957 RepID=UPI001A5CEE64|nr:flagellar biosynthesis protein [Gemmobacter sp.]MBL8561371.1 flagellar biosynthesis protein [Gemmobacter sp.]